MSHFPPSPRLPVPSPPRARTRLRRRSRLPENLRGRCPEGRVLRGRYWGPVETFNLTVEPRVAWPPVGCCATTVPAG